MICGLYKTPASPESCSHSHNPVLRRTFVMSATTATIQFPEANKNMLTVHARLNSSDLPSPEALGYTLGKTLGSGTYAKVKAAWSPYEKKMIAIKILNKKAASKEYLSKFLPRETAIMQSIKHPNVIRLYELIETEKYAFFMLELAENGDLLDYINARRYLPEPEARHIFKQMAGAIAYCHSRGVVHRDLKCENIMLNRDMEVKVGDFGFALDLNNAAAKTPCGSYSYAAPELFTNNGDPYDGKKADVWSLGVILYAMLCGRLPFGDDSQVKKMQGRLLSFSKPLSIDCRVFIQSLLNTNVAERLDSNAMLVSEWPMVDTVKTPLSLLHPPQPKYTIANCLPSDIDFPQTRAPAAQPPTLDLPVSMVTASNAHAHRGCQKTVRPPSSGQKPTSSYMKVPKPLVAKIGACGRRIADAVKHVGNHQKSHHMDYRGIPERATT